MMINEMPHPYLEGKKSGAVINPLFSGDREEVNPFLFADNEEMKEEQEGIPLDLVINPDRPLAPQYLIFALSLMYEGSSQKELDLAEKYLNKPEMLKDKMAYFCVKYFNLKYKYKEMKDKITYYDLGWGSSLFFLFPENRSWLEKEIAAFLETAEKNIAEYQSCRVYCDNNLQKNAAKALIYLLQNPYASSEWPSYDEWEQQIAYYLRQKDNYFYGWDDGYLATTLKDIKSELLSTAEKLVASLGEQASCVAQSPNAESFLNIHKVVLKKVEKYIEILSALDPKVPVLVTNVELTDSAKRLPGFSEEDITYSAEKINTEITYYPVLKAYSFGKENIIVGNKINQMKESNPLAYLWEREVVKELGRLSNRISALYPRKISSLPVNGINEFIESSDPRKEAIMLNQDFIKKEYNPYCAFVDLEKRVMPHIKEYERHWNQRFKTKGLSR